MHGKRYYMILNYLLMISKFWLNIISDKLVFTQRKLTSVRNILGHILGKIRRSIVYKISLWKIKLENKLKN